jgi:hypothetical protein
MRKCYVCNTVFNNNHNLQQHLNTHGLTEQQLHLCLAANALAASRRSAIPVTRDIHNSQRNSSDNAREDSLETLITTNSDSSPMVSTANYYDTDQQDDFNYNEINNGLDGDNDHNIQSSSTPIFDFVLDVNELPGHVFGEEEEEVNSSTSSSSSSDEEDASLHLPARVTRASNKKAVSSTAVHGSSPDLISHENMTTELFFKKFFDEDSAECNNSQMDGNLQDNTSTNIFGNHGQMEGPPLSDSLWNILPEAIKTKLQEDQSINVNYNLLKLLQKRGKDGYLSSELNKKEEHQLLLLKMCVDAKVPIFL